MSSAFDATADATTVPTAQLALDDLMAWVGVDGLAAGTPGGAGAGARAGGRPLVAGRARLGRDLQPAGGGRALGRQRQRPGARPGLGRGHLARPADRPGLGRPAADPGTADGADTVD